MFKMKGTKRSLLMSALALLLCVSMLIGSTFAWFTDSVTSAGNKIQAGTLKIDLELLEKNEDGSTKWTSLKDSKAPIFNYDKWEPGYTDVKILKVENEGTLALKWVAKFVSANDLTELANVIDVYVKPSADEFGYANDRTDLSTWTKKGTVAEFVNTISETTYGNLEAGKAAYLGIALKMQESADNKYQGKDLGGAFDIMILATQYTSESDSFNNQYDAKYDFDIWDGKTVTAPEADADGVYHITSAADLVGMMNVTGNSIYKGKTIVLDNNIDLGGRTVKGIGGISTNFAGVFDGQGYTISNFKVDSTENSYYAGLFNQVSHGGTIKNLTVKNATIVGNSMVGAVASSLDNAVIDNCKAIDCTLIGVKKVGAVVGYSAGSTVTNNYAENCTVIYSEKEGGEILGYENTGSTVSNNTANNVSVKQGVAVSTASELSAALNKTYTEDTTVMLTKDITLTGEWGAHSLNGSNNANLVIDGNGKTIYGLTSSNYYNLSGFNSNGLVTNIGPGFSSVTFKNLTIDGANLTNNGGQTAATGVFVGDTNTVDVTFDTCTVTGAVVNSYKYAGGFIGYIQDVYGNKSIKLINCVVSDSNINTTDSSVGGLVGQHYTNLTITGCKIMGTTTIKCAENRTGKKAKAGYLLGTATVKTTTISNITVESTVTLNTMGGTTYDTTNYVGRIDGGATVNGVTPNS